MPNYTIYVKEKGRRNPVKTELMHPFEKKIPNTIEHEGDTYYWIGADISAKTLTYADWRSLSEYSTKKDDHP